MLASACLAAAVTETSARRLRGCWPLGLPRIYGATFRSKKTIGSTFEERLANHSRFTLHLHQEDTLLLTIRDSQMKQMADSSPGTKMVQACNKTHWIEFRMVDRDNKPVPGEQYIVRLPDQSLMTGSLDRDGKVRFEEIVAGRASICFPGMDRMEWRPLGGSAPAP